MPELTFYREDPDRTPTPMVCMYCGAPAAHRWEWRVANPPDDRDRGGGGNDLVAPAGDDAVSGAIALIQLPFVLWDAAKGIASIRAARRKAAETGPPPALDPPDTPVAVTACDRHRHFSRRFILAGLAGLVALVPLWWVGVVAVQSDAPAGAGLLTAALLLTLFGPIGLALWYTLAGPVIVDRVTRDTVVLDRVRDAYFAAVGGKP